MLRIFNQRSRPPAVDRSDHGNTDADTLNVEIGAEVAGFEPDYFDKRQLGMLDRFSQFGLVAAREAVSDSGISRW